MNRWIVAPALVWAVACGAPAKGPDVTTVDVDPKGDIARDGSEDGAHADDPDADPSMGIVKKRKSKRDKVFDDLRGVFEFGMTVPQVRKAITKQIEERYEELIRKAEDVFSADKLRERKKLEISRLDHVPFDGKPLGWDSSLIDDQFRHKLDESMMVYWENHQGKDQRRFFFFYKGRLFKMLIALNTKSIANGASLDFSRFRQLLERSYGSGKLVSKKTDDGDSIPVRVDWKSPLYSIRALDKLPIYGSFALVIASRSHETRVAKNRARHPLPKKQRNNIIESIRERDGDAPGIDDNVDALDKVIKKPKK